MTAGEVGVFREHWAYSSAKAERELGYRSRPLAEGIRATVEWLREKGAA
jgi:nucleoside-diphosphate-sugar epimerase